MPINLEQKIVPTVGKIIVKEQDGSPMIDPTTGEAAYARVHSPASKTWEVANATRRRKSMKRVRENGGKIEAAADTPEDVIEFLCAVTEEFVGLEVGLPEGETGAKAMVRAIYSKPGLGYIRDQMDGDSRDWAAFTTGSTSN